MRDFYRRVVEALRPWAALLTLASMLAVFTALKWPVLSVPYYWDEMIVYVRPALWLYDHSLLMIFPHNRPPDLFFGHSPGFSFLLAVMLRVFGEHFWVGHGYALFLSLILMIYLFRLGRHFAGIWGGFLACYCLFFLPVIYSGATMVVADLGALTFCTAALYYFAAGNAWGFLFAGLLAAFMKETSAALLVPAAVMASRDWKQAGLRRTVAWMLPAVAIALFFLSEKVFTGNFSNFPFTSTLSLAPGPWLARSAKNFFTYFILSDWTSVLTALALAGGWLLWRRGGEERRFAALAAAFVGCNVLGVGLFLAINHRYFIPAYAALALFAAVALAALPSRIPSLGFLLFFAHMWYPTHYGRASIPVYGYESSMQYLDVIAVEREAAAYLEANHATKKISAVWPMDAVLMEPRYGYVTRPLTISDRGTAPETADLVVLAANGDPLLLHRKDVLFKNSFTRERRFSHNGKWIEIWSRPVPAKKNRKSRNLKPGRHG